MIPITDYVREGETIYFAVHAKHADLLDEIGAAILSAVSNLQEFRLLLMVFSDRLELLHLSDDTTIDHLRDVLSIRQEWREGNALDPPIGVMLADHAAVVKRERPTLFVFSDGEVTCHWNPGLVSQLIQFVWLHTATTESVSTPFGKRHEVEFLNAVYQRADRDPQENGERQG